MSVGHGGIGWRWWARRLRSDLALLVALVVAVLAGSFALALTPRAIETASVRDLRATVADAPAELRNVRARFEGRIVPAADPLERVVAFGRRVLDDDQLDATRDVVVDELVVVDTPRFEVTSFPDRRRGTFPTTFRFRFQPGIEDESELVEGRWPRVHDDIVELDGVDCPDLPVEEFRPDPDVACEIVAVPVIETVLTAATAADMDVAVGDLVTLSPNLVEVQWQLSGVRDLRIVLSVVGIVELSDLGREFWYDDNRLHTARVTEDADIRVVAATGLVLPEQYPAVHAAVPRIDHEYTWRFLVDPDRMELATADELAVELANVSLRTVEFDTGLPDLVDASASQRRVVLVVLSTAAVGLAVVVVGVAVTLTMLLAARQARSTALIVARGAGPAQLLADAVRTGLALAAPAAVVGWAAARWALPGTGSRASVRAVVAFAGLVAVAVVVASVRGRGVRTAAASDSPASVGERRGRRAVVEIAVLTVAVGAVLAVRRRGEATGAGIGAVDPLLAVRRRGEATGAGIGAVDPLLAATPVLVAVAVGVVAVRTIGPMARLLGAVARRRRGAVLFVGVRQLRAQPGAARLAVGTMLVPVAVAVFAASSAASIGQGRAASSWYDVGADITISADLTGLPLPLEIDAIAGRGDLTTAARTTLRGTRVEVARREVAVDVVAIAAADYAAVLADAPIAPAGLDLLAEPIAAADPPRALVSGDWAVRPAPATGDVMTVDVGGSAFDVVVAARIEAFPGVTAGRPFVVVDAAALGSVSAVPRPTELHVRDGGRGSLAAELRGELADLAPRTRLVDRAQVLDEISADPLSAWTLRLLRWTVVAAAAFAGVAAAAALTIALISRAADAAILRTLGLDGRRSGVVAVVEHAPTIVVAAGGGAVGGALAFWSTLPALGLARFAGPGRPIDVSVDLPATVVTAALLLVAMVVAIGATMWARRRTDLATTLRMGDTS